MQISYLAEEFKQFFNRIIIWKKSNPNPTNAQYNYLADIEMALVCKKNKAGFNNKYVSSVFEYPTQPKQIHPCEKNHLMLAKLILDNTNERDIVYDACSGSGSTLLQAIKYNRKAIGTEINKKYFEKANERLERFKSEYILYRINNGETS